MKRPIILLFLLFTAIHSYSQTDQEKAEMLGIRAIKMMDNGQVDEAISLLKKAEKLNPGSYIYPYELGFAYVKKKEFGQAIKYFKKSIKKPNSTDQCWQMLGNAHDYNGHPEKAIKTYSKGLELYPSSGRLHLELANMYLMAEEYATAITIYEAGILADPDYPSNYYRLALLFAQSSEKIWALLYGEIFMNLEPNSKRTEDISHLMYDLYQHCILLNGDSSRVEIIENQELELDISRSNEMDHKLPFSFNLEKTATHGLLALELNPEKDSLLLNDLVDFRKQMLIEWYKQSLHTRFPNILLEYQHKLLENNMFEAYSYWLLQIGGADISQKWMDEHPIDLDRFRAWYKKNPLEINEFQYFLRNDYLN